MALIAGPQLHNCGYNGSRLDKAIPNGPTTGEWAMRPFRSIITGGDRTGMASSAPTWA